MLHVMVLCPYAAQDLVAMSVHTTQEEDADISGEVPQAQRVVYSGKR